MAKPLPPTAAEEAEHIEFFRANPSVLCQDTLWQILAGLQQSARTNQIPTRHGMVFFDALAWTIARLIAGSDRIEDQDLMIEELRDRLPEMVAQCVMRHAEVARGTVDREKMN